MVEVASVQRLRVHPLPSVRHREQSHRRIRSSSCRRLPRNHLNTDVRVGGHAEQVLQLPLHDLSAADCRAQAALVQYRYVQGALGCEESLLPTESCSHPFCEFVGTAEAAKQCLRVLLRLQQPGNGLRLVLAHRDGHLIHLRPTLEPVGMFHLWIPVDAYPQPHQHPAGPQDLVARLGEDVLRDAVAGLHAGDLRAVAGDLSGQGLLGEAGLLAEVAQDLAEDGGGRGGGCGAGRGVASAHEHSFVIACDRGPVTRGGHGDAGSHWATLAALKVTARPGFRAKTQYGESN